MTTNEEVTLPTPEEAAQLAEKWEKWEKKQKREIFRDSVVCTTAIFGLAVAVPPLIFKDKTPECPADMDLAQLAQDATDLAQTAKNTITLKDGTTCVMTFKHS